LVTHLINRLLWLRIGNHEPIAVILPDPLKRILDGTKRWEIRSRPLRKHIGKRLWLAQSGSSTVYGHSKLVDSIGPLSPDTWSAKRTQHQVDGERMYGDHTHAWVLHDVCRCDPLLIQRKAGAIQIQLGPWAA
jgi:hypothetical protein